MASSSAHSILGQKLFDGKTKTIYSIIDQPGLICIHRKDNYQRTGLILTIPGSRRASTDNLSRFANLPRSRSETESEITTKGVLITSITACVYEILREASIPTFYVAPHPQSDMFIAKKCTMIPILWIIHRLANETYVKRNPGIEPGHRFVPPMIEIYYKRHPVVYRRATIGNLDENSEADRENQFDDEDSDSDECISSIWSYEQLLNMNINIETMKISSADIEYMYEICCTVFDILEHVWMMKKHCQLVDLKLEFGMTTTPSKEIVLANVYDVDTWHILRPIERISLAENSVQENLHWINNSLRDILDLNIHLPLKMKMISDYKNEDEMKVDLITESFSPVLTSRCIIVCSALSDVDYAQKMKTTLNELYNIQCDIRLLSIQKSIQTIRKFLSNYSYEHCRPTVFVTLGNINNGLATCLSSNSQYPIIHCSYFDKEQSNHLFDIHSFISTDTSLFTVVFTLSSAIQNVIQILAINDWRLWTKQRGRRFKKYMDFITADQLLTTTQTVKTNNAMLLNIGTHLNVK